MLFRALVERLEEHQPPDEDEVGVKFGVEEEEQKEAVKPTALGRLRK